VTPSRDRPGGTGDLGLLILLGVIWGAAFPIIRLGLLAGASPLTFAADRMAFAALLMAGLAALAREPFPSRRNLLLSLLVGGGSMVGGYAALLYWGEQSTAGGLAAVLIGSVPLWSALAGFILLPKERFGSIGSAGVAIGFGGVVTLFYPSLASGGVGSAIGALAVVGAALSAGVGSVVLRRLTAQPQGAWGLTAQFGSATVLLFALVALTGSPSTIPATPPVLLSLAYLVGLSSVAGYWIYFRLHHRVGPGRTNLVTYINPLTGILVGSLLLGEQVGLPELAGFALIVGGLVLVQSDAARKRRRESVRSAEDNVAPGAADSPARAEAANAGR
jgi:probable blue pigment (indigoidine) exporter